MDPSTLKKFELFKDVDESALGKIAPFTMLVEFPGTLLLVTHETRRPRDRRD